MRLKDRNKEKRRGKKATRGWKEGGQTMRRRGRMGVKKKSR